jgi:hypothetical protein
VLHRNGSVRVALAAISMLGVASLSGCASIAITLAGLGVGVGSNHYLNNVNYHTFTEPMVTVRQAALTGLIRIGADLERTEIEGTNVLILAKTDNGDIKIELQALTAKATRMRTVAHQDDALLLDGATAAEVARQTEKALAVISSRDARAASVDMPAVPTDGSQPTELAQTSFSRPLP